MYLLLLLYIYIYIYIWEECDFSILNETLLENHIPFQITCKCDFLIELEFSETKAWSEITNIQTACKFPEINDPFSPTMPTNKTHNHKTIYKSRMKVDVESASKSQ